MVSTDSESQIICFVLMLSTMKLKALAVSCKDLFNIIYVTFVIHSDCLTSKVINWLRKKNKIFINLFCNLDSYFSSLKCKKSSLINNLIINVMEVLVAFIAFFATVFGIYYVHITTRNKERMALIEKGADASLFNTGKEGINVI